MASLQALQPPIPNAPLSAVKLEHLSKYVQQKFKISTSLQVKPEDISTVQNTCFRRLRFTPIADRSSGSGITLYLSPDEQFLSKELFNSEVDPILEDQAKEQDLRRSLIGIHSPVLGPAGAATTITIFSDFQCPFCRLEAKVLRTELLPAEPNVRIVFRFLPLPMHDWGRQAAEAAACASYQGSDAFWNVHDFLFDRQLFLRESTIVSEVESYAESLAAFDNRKFAECLERHLSAGDIEVDLAAARHINVDSTPTLFVNGVRVSGVASVEQLRTLIRQSVVAARPSDVTVDAASR